MPKVFTSKTQKIGELGESITCKFLMKQGYEIIERNYTKKWGEIDIVAQKANKLHFIEVKSVSCESLSKLSDSKFDNYRPEDNMHPWKLQRLSRVIQTYLLQNSKFEDINWQIDLICVFIDINNKKARVKVVKDIIL